MDKDNLSKFCTCKDTSCFFNVVDKEGKREGYTFADFAKVVNGKESNNF